MDVKMFFHNDIDGICSASICMEWLPREGDVILTPVQSHWRGPAFEKLVRKYDGMRVISLDYEEPPQPYWLWVDHHFNVSRGGAASLSSRHIYDPKSKSATALMVKFIESGGDTNTAHLSNIVNQVDKIDSGDYDSLAEVFESREPLMALNAYLEMEFPSDMMFCRVAETLVSTGLDVSRALKRMDIDSRYAVKMWEASKRATDMMTVYQNIGVIDQQRRNQFPRYSEYYHAPHIEYAVRISRVGNGELYVQMGKNKWCKTAGNQDIGDFLRRISYKISGGGHANGGGCIIKTCHYDRFIDDLCITFNRGDVVEMEKYGVDASDPVEKRAEELIKTGEITDPSDAREKAQKGADVVQPQQ